MVSAARATVRALCDGAPAVQFEALAERGDAFAACLRDGTLARLVEEELAELARDPLHMPDRAAPHSWTLELGTACTLRLIRLPQTRADNGFHLLGSSGHRLVALASPAAQATLEIYRHAPGPMPDLDPVHQLAPAQRLPLATGQVAGLHAWCDVAEWEPQPLPPVSAVLLSPPVHAQHWVYRRDDRRPCELVSTTFGANRLQYALELLAEIGAPEHAATTAGLYAHAAHHVRWAAIKATLDLDEDAGRRLLLQARHDPHPHVAAAAERGLRALDEASAWR
jgi:hypothetical protein